VSARKTHSGDFWKAGAGRRGKRNTWITGAEPIETAMEGSFHDGVKFAAEFLEGEGQKALAGKLRARVQRRV